MLAILSEHRHWSRFPNNRGFRVQDHLDSGIGNEIAVRGSLHFVRAVGQFVHQPIRQVWNRSVPNELSARMHVNIAIFATTYLVLHVLGRWNSHHLRLIMALGTAAYLIYALVTQPVLFFQGYRLEKKVMRVNEAGQLAYKE